MNFSDKVVIITGGSKGFGRGLAKAFAEAKSHVVIASPDESVLLSTAKELLIDSFVCDVTVPEQVETLADYAVSKYGRIDVWINNAGIQIAPSNVEDVNPTKLRELFDINFFGYFYGCQVALRRMKPRNSGTIININSTAGLDGKPGISAYVASKFAVKGLTQSIRKELTGTDIKVYGIHPGGMQTEIYKEKYPSDFNEYMSVDYAIQEIMNNFKDAEPEIDLIIRRPSK